ncbi:protein MIZU-KUSSEI 1-like [Iris pallida]|uniref:Protein MIZU-KUSSEI 1-like n=1 Tax=Iris pallida TaxID=29817 RepID=A0AAX6DR95_IRIPA|nr:protein MIZU-KUSSEI 1-like [Iris pallida]
MAVMAVLSHHLRRTRRRKRQRCRRRRDHPRAHGHRLHHAEHVGVRRGAPPRRRVPQLVPVAVHGPHRLVQQRDRPLLRAAVAVVRPLALEQDPDRPRGHLPDEMGRGGGELQEEDRVRPRGLLHREADAALLLPEEGAGQPSPSAGAGGRQGGGRVRGGGEELAGWYQEGLEGGDDGAEHRGYGGEGIEEESEGLRRRRRGRCGAGSSSPCAADDEGEGERVGGDVGRRGGEGVEGGRVGEVHEGLHIRRAASDHR